MADLAALTQMIETEAKALGFDLVRVALFGKGDVTTLDERTLLDATSELPGGEVSVGTPVVEALVAAGLVESRKAARRAIAEGGVLPSSC